MKTKNIKYYIKFDEETFDDAITAHSEGFDTIEEAAFEANLDGPVKFVIFDSNLKVVRREKPKKN